MGYRAVEKNLLFIEPFLSSATFLYDAQMNGYGTFVLSDNNSCLRAPKENFRGGIRFFQVDTLNEQSVLSIVKQINQKFTIHGIIPEYSVYDRLSAKIAHYLKKPGVSLQAMKDMRRNKLFLNDKAKSETKNEYRIDGLINNNKMFLFSVTEKIFLTELKHKEEGYIIRADIDPIELERMMNCLQNVISNLKIGYGFFYAHINQKNGEVILLNFKLGFAETYMSKLISYVIGIPYNSLIYKLFSSQPLSLHAGKKSNVGIIFFYRKLMKEKKIKEILSPHGFLIEIKEYVKEQVSDQSFSEDISCKAYVILKHENYVILKERMEKILIKSA